MVYIQDIPQSIVNYNLLLVSISVLILIARSYWTWAILIVLIIVNQLLGVSEKLWIKVTHVFDADRTVLMYL